MEPVTFHVSLVVDLSECPNSLAKVWLTAAVGYTGSEWAPSMPLPSDESLSIQSLHFSPSLDP